MVIWHISDTHNKHRELCIPKEKIDIVIHSGDCANSHITAINLNEIQEFFDWFDALEINRKIFIPGNHDVGFDRLSFRPEYKSHIDILIDKELIIDGVKFYGSPYTPSYGKCWGYMKDRGKMSGVWSAIPNDTDILITHGPPNGILDLSYDNRSIVQAGCTALRRRVFNIKPYFHLFGHMHDQKNLFNYGTRQIDNTVYVNSACSIILKQEIHGGNIIRMR